MLNNEINGRYKQLMASMNKDVPDFVTEVKGTPAKYYRILRGEVKPNFDTLFELMEAYPQINGDWLLTGRGEMYISNNTGSGIGSQRPRQESSRRLTWFVASVADGSVLIIWFHIQHLFRRTEVIGHL